MAVQGASVYKYYPVCTTEKQDSTQHKTQINRASTVRKITKDLVGAIRESKDGKRIAKEIHSDTRSLGNSKRISSKKFHSRASRR